MPIKAQSPEAGRKDADVFRKATALTLDVKDQRGAAKAAAGGFLDASEHSTSRELASGSFRPAA